jgi:hypothetical protein
MIRNMCGLFASYQWLLYIYHQLMVTLTSTCHVLSNIYTPFSALPHFGGWDGGGGSCHDSQSDPRMYIHFLLAAWIWNVAIYTSDLTIPSPEQFLN